MCDNQAVVAVLNAKFARNFELRGYARELVDLELQLGCQIVAEWLPSETNVVADDLSRQWDYAEVTVCAGDFAAWQTAVGGCLRCDRFSSSQNFRLPYYNSYRWDGRAGGVDAFAATDWHEAPSWVHPPSHLYNKFAAFRETICPTAPMVVLVARAEAAPWFGMLWRHALDRWDVDRAGVLLHMPAAQPRRAEALTAFVFAL